MTPLQQLAAAIRAQDGAPNVYEGGSSQPIVPAVIVRPDTPWRSRAGFGFDVERYVALSAVTAATPDDGVTVLDDLQALIRRAVDDTPGFAFHEAGTMFLDQSTGVPLLATASRLTYRGERPEAMA